MRTTSASVSSNERQCTVGARGAVGARGVAGVRISMPGIGGRGGMGAMAAPGERKKVKLPPSCPFSDDALTVVTFTVRARLPLTTVSSSTSPGLALATSRDSRFNRELDTQPSSMSSFDTLSETPLIDAMRSPSTMPAFSAGPSSVTEFTNTPAVSRLEPVRPNPMPITARSSALRTVRFRGSRSSAATVLTL